MKVLISAYVCDPKGGSEGANAWFTAEGLAHAGAHVHVLTREADRSGTEAAIQTLGCEVPGQLSATYLPDSVSGSLSYGQIGIYARYAAWQARAHGWASDPANGSWDVGHHVSWASLSHPIGLVGCPFPLIIGPVGGGQTLHPEHEKWYDGPLARDRMRRMLLRKLMPMNPISRKAARSATLVLANNLETWALAESLGARDVRMQLADGVREGYLLDSPPPFPATPTVVWVGRFLPLKAARLAVQAFRLALRKVPGAKLIFVGDGPTKETAQRYAADLVDEGTVTFTGHLPWAEAQSILAGARVHLFTSVRDSFGAQNLESAALGVPTVAMNAYGAAEFLRRVGFTLVDPLPGKSLDLRFADAMAVALHWSPEEWRTQSAGVLRFASENMYRARATAWLNLYRIAGRTG